MKIAKHKQWKDSFPRYKLQYYDPRSKVWRELQRESFDTIKAAIARGMELKCKYRVVEVKRNSRRVL